MIPEAAVAFVADLLRLPIESPEHVVGHWVWEHMGGDDREGAMLAVNDVMCNWPAGTRFHELAVNVWLLLGGAGVAA